MTTARGWMKGAAIGCAAIAALVIVLAGVLVAVNWPAVKGSYRRASSAMSGVMQVMSAVQSKYGGAVAVNVRSQNGVKGAILSLTLTNPPLLEQIDPEGPAAKEKALEIAATARDALPVEGRYEHYEIILARSQGSVVNVSRTWVFRFDAADLPAK